MLVVDTNVIVRYLTNDDTAQATRARRLLAQQSIFVPLTVLLETEWVLRSVYGFGASAVVHALRAFAGLPRVTLESPETAALAFDWVEQGMDFADALHLAAARKHDGLATFDKTLARAARKLAGPPVHEP